MTKRIIWILICLSLLVIIGSAEKVTVVDFTGRSVSVDAPVHRVVSLGTGVAGYIYALDGGQSLVGRDSYSYFPPDIEEIAIAGKSSYAPDLELIVKLQPDLVIMATHGMAANFPFGSVAEKVIKNSPVPVLSINPKPRE